MKSLHALAGKKKTLSLSVVSSLVELQLVSLIWACKYNAKLWVYHSWRRWWATYLSSDSRLDPCTLCENVNSRFLFLLFFYRHFSKELGKQLIRIKTDLSTALIASSLGAKPIAASRARVWPGVWFMFTVNWKQWKGARLPPVCMLSGCRVGFLSSGAESHMCLCFVFFTLSWKKCRWIAAAKCVSWSPCWKSWEEAGLAGGSNENVRWPASIQLYKLMVSMKCQSKLLNQERATRLVVLQSPPLPPLLLDGNLLKAENSWWVSTGQTQWG